MPEPAVIQVMNSFKRDLLNRDEAQRARMARQWRQVEANLLGEVERFAERVSRDGLTPAQIRSRQFQLDRFTSLLAQARVELNKYADIVEPQIIEQQRTFGAKGAQSAIAAIGAVTGNVRAGFDVLPKSTIENLVGLAGDGSPLRHLLERSYGAGANGMFDQLLRGVALGANPRVIARNMVRNGLSQTLNQVMVMARTEPLRVYRESSRQQYNASGVVDYFRRLATRDRRTCPACLFADGEVYELGDTLRAHPQCRCTTIPVVKGFKPVEWEKGKDWFIKQPPAVQRKMLGNGIYDLWNRKIIQLEDTVKVKQDPIWGDSLQPNSLKDILAGNFKTFYVRGLPEPEPVKPKRQPAPKINKQTATQARAKIAKLEKGTDKQIGAITKQVADVDKQIEGINKQIGKLYDEIEKHGKTVARYNERVSAGTVTNDDFDRLRVAQKARLAAYERVSELDLEVTNLLTQKVDLGRQIQDIRRRLKADALKVVQVDDPGVTTIRYSAGTPKNVAAHFQAATDEFNKLVSNDILWDVFNVDITRLRPGGRAFARPELAEIHITSDEDTRVIIHELGHILEVRGAGNLQKALDFYDRRTAGEALEKLSKLTGISAYDPREKARPDKFIHPYMGKEYGRDATEIVSMGIEYMYDETARFAKEDPDYFDFIYNLLRNR